LDRAAESDVLILGPPIYFYTESGQLRSFMERFLFRIFPKSLALPQIFPVKKRGLVYTMNIKEEEMPTFRQDKTVAASQEIMAYIFGSARFCSVLTHANLATIRNMSRRSGTQTPS